MYLVCILSMFHYLGILSRSARPSDDPLDHAHPLPLPQPASAAASLDEHRHQSQSQPVQKPRPARKHEQKDPLAQRLARTTAIAAKEDYLDEHERGNHSSKTLQWHRTALTLFCRFLERERNITLIGEVDVTDISAWFAHLRKTPGSRGKMRGERTVQTYAC